MTALARGTAVALAALAAQAAPATSPWEYPGEARKAGLAGVVAEDDARKWLKEWCALHDSNVRPTDS